MKLPQKLLTALVALLLHSLALAQAEPSYQISTLPWQGDEDDRFRLADMNADGRSDFIMFHWRETEGRTISIYLQDARGQFSPQPSKQLSIAPEIIAVGIADLSAEAGQEFLLLDASSAYRLNAWDGSDKVSLFAWELIGAVPHRRKLELLDAPFDYNGDGHADILLPGQTHFSLFLGNAEYRFQPSAAIPYVREPENQQTKDGEPGLSVSIRFTEKKGLNLRAQATRSGPFSNLLGTWKFDADAQTPTGLAALGESALLADRRWVSAVTQHDFNGDAKADIAILEGPESKMRQLNIYLQQDAGRFDTENPQQYSLKIQGSLAFDDIDGDGLTDVIDLVVDGSDGKLYLYQNGAHGFDFKKANQVFKFSGQGQEVVFSDLDNDGLPELCVSDFSLSAIEALRQGNISRTLMIYSGETKDGAKRLFNRRPSSKLKQQLDGESMRSMTEFSFDADINGDGRKEVLMVAEDGGLVAYAMDAGFQLADKPLWGHRLSQPLMQLQSLKLNQDARTDLVLKHKDSISILVSREPL